ncbi:MAG: nickel/cobalt transporter (NiCoT) family protein [Frankiales bacterium]|jgi:high-affinity nickel-transport protein|nr:nickel/cobalt transporter (NiCoT) family protein [Frankiales bacterium]MDX6316210.1 nickel/cobalt transporter (NiCoT) family protein [Streptomyces sp.]
MTLLQERPDVRPPLRERLAPEEWRRLGGMFGVIALLHVTGGVLLWLGSRGHYRIDSTTTFGLGTGALAYTLGMRHAFDADHISAIDNTTRKLMAEGKRPLGVGFFFSLGHSSVVMGLTVLLGLGAKALGSEVRDQNSSLHHYTGLIGTSVSGTFLLLIALLNVIVMVGILKVFRDLRRGLYDEEELEQQLNSRGFLMRFFGPLARSIDTSWKMYPLGILFGLGFDTATEIALLVLAGTSVAAGLPFWALLSLPLLFAGGMSLLDTIDGSFMNFAYGWAFSRPVRKVYYNLVITGLSILVAVFIGGLEVAQVFSQQLRLSGGFWDYANGFNLNRAGFLIVGIFVGVWALALGIWRFGRVEERWETSAAEARALPEQAA